VIRVTAAIVAYNCADIFRHGIEITDQVFHGFLLKVGALDRLVQVIDVSLMMLGVVNFHCARIDVRLQRIIRIG
jgi:hypothetical protein